MLHKILPVLSLLIVAPASLASELSLKHHFSPSPDGKLMVFHGRNNPAFNSLYLSDITANNTRLLFGDDKTIQQEPRWSPDGQWIAFVHGTEYQSGALQLAMLKPDGSSFKVLTNTQEGMVKGPSWSPDSSQIVYEIRNPEVGKSTLHIYDLNKQQSRPLTQNGMIVQPEWSPDGKAILTVIRDSEIPSNSDIWILSVEHPDHRRRWTTTPEGETMPVWSPDGESIYYSRPAGENNQYDLFQLTFKTGIVKRLTETEDISEFFPIMSQDKNTLLYDSYRLQGSTPTSTLGVLHLQKE